MLYEVITWQVEVSKDDEGWTAEIAIPFKTISFDPSDDTWGLNFRRDLGYGDERNGWVSYNNQQNPSNFGRVVGLQDLHLGMGLDVVPSISVTGHRDYSAATDDSATEPSLDIRNNFV